MKILTGWKLLLGSSILILAACSVQNEAPPSTIIAEPKGNPAPSATPSSTSKPTASPSPIPSATSTPTPTRQPTATPTTTPTHTPAPTSTPDSPQAVAQTRAFCRYGPGKAYLYSHELKEGDQALIEGRNASGTWLWLQPENLERHCWAAASVLIVTGDVNTLPVVQSRLPHSTLYDSPKDVEATRQGDQVIVEWQRVSMTADDDRGYLLQVTLCQSGRQVSQVVHTEEEEYSFTDESGCSGASGGQLYAVEKHGYTDPVTIPWPD